MPRCRRCRSGRSGRGARTGPSGRGPRSRPRRGRATRLAPVAIAPLGDQRQARVGLGLVGEPLLGSPPGRSGLPCGLPRRFRASLSISQRRSSTSAGAASRSAEGDLRPLDPEQALSCLGSAPCSCAGSSGRRARAPTVATGAPAPSARVEGHRRPRRGRDPHPQLPGSLGPQGDAAPGEGQPQLRGSLACGKRDAVQGGVEQGRVDAEALGILGLLLGQGDLGVDLLALAPGGAQALEGGAVLEAVLGEEVVEVGDLDRLGALGRPGVEGFGGWGGVLGEGAAGVLGPLAPPRPRGGSGSRSRGGRPRRGRRPRPGSATAPVSGRTSGACRVSSSTLSAPTCSAARSASSRKAVPGRRTVPPTAWSASQGWVARERRPVRVRPSPLGSSIAAASSGCSAVCSGRRRRGPQRRPVESSQ